MDFLIKYLKELNSANSEKLMILSIILGLISGFLPTFNILTFIIIFIVFTIRIPLGLYFASWGAFNIIGYFMDYIFHKTGLIILQSNILNSLWTNLYNTPLLRWSGFNNSIIMGSLVWGIGLSIILYIILSKSISSYRKNIFPKIAQIPYLKWIIPKEDKKGIFRFSGLLVITTISGLIISFFIFFTDPIIKSVLQFSLSKTLHKPVSIQKVNTSFSNLSLNIYKTKIGNFQIDDIYLKFSWKYLVWKKFDITKLIIKNLHTNKTITDFINKNTKTATKTHNFNINFNIPDASKLISNYQLETIQQIKKLKKDYKTLETLINSINKNIKSQNQNISKIKDDIKLLEKTSKHIKTMNDIQKILSQVDNIKKNINSIKTEIKKYKTQITDAKNLIQQDLQAIKTASKHDYAKLSSQYNMIKNKEYLQFAQTILKPEISNYINKAINIYNRVKPYMKSEKKEEYIRGKGTNIKFKDKIYYPDFVLNLAQISGKTKYTTFTTDIHNITDNQKILKKSTILNLNSKSKYYKSLNIYSTYFIDKFSLNTKLNNLKIESLQKNNIILTNPIINLISKININKNSLNSISNINIYTSKLIYKNNKMISDALNNIKNIKIATKIYGKLDKFNIKINSNIDKLLSASLNKLINKQIIKQKAKLQTLINNKIKNQIKGINLNIIDSTNSKLEFNQNILKDLKKKLLKYSKNYLSKKLLKGGISKFF